MNPFERKFHNNLHLHPELWQVFLAEPSQDSLDFIITNHLLEKPCLNLTPWILNVLPLWEELAFESNPILAELIRQLENCPKLSPIPDEDRRLRPHLQRIRILALTPGLFPFTLEHIRNNLTQFLESSDILADLPQLAIIAFSKEEITPLTSELLSYRLHPHGRRYVQNLFYPERREAILSVLAYIAKNYPLMGICRQAYAIMLSLEDESIWSKHPFCLRLIANRFWEYHIEENIGI